MTLRAYGSYDHSITDLEFLRFFPTLRRFGADALWDSLTSLDGLRHLPAGARRARHRRDEGDGSTSPVLSRFRGAAVALPRGPDEAPGGDLGPARLYDLTLRSITMPDLSLLLPLTGLRSLDIKLGGTRDLGLLPRVGELATSSSG